jgi:hypothetical protein
VLNFEAHLKKKYYRLRTVEGLPYENHDSGWDAKKWWA